MYGCSGGRWGEAGRGGVGGEACAQRSLNAPGRGRCSELQCPDGFTAFGLMCQAWRAAPGHTEGAPCPGSPPSRRCSPAARPLLLKRCALQHGRNAIPIMWSATAAPARSSEHRPGAKWCRHRPTATSVAHINRQRLMHCWNACHSPGPLLACLEGRTKHGHAGTHSRYFSASRWVTRIPICSFAALDCRIWAVLSSMSPWRHHPPARAFSLRNDKFWPLQTRVQQLVSIQSRGW